MEKQQLFVEFHVLRSHAPGNMNRDDLGAPKNALFGGVRRLRVSSQCVKRTWRTSEFFRTALVGEKVYGHEVLGVRTRKLPTEARARLGKDFDAEALDGLDVVLQRIGRSKAPSKEDLGTTAHLLFLTQEELEAVATFARKHKNELAKVAQASAELAAAQAAPPPAEEGEAPAADTKKKGAKKSGGKKADTKAQEEALGTKVAELLSLLAKHMKEAAPRNAVDVALFGRFVTSDEFPSVDAAMQVAHALGTQKVELEYDYFVAVDDKKTEEDPAGAGHLGETEFAQSVLYQYAVCDWRSLVGNLAGFGEHTTAIAARALYAVALAATRAVPKGKANGTAPQNPADYLEVVVRRDAPVSLANAFLKPVSARDGDARDVMDLSIAALQAQLERYHRGYSTDEDVVARLVFSLRDGDLTKLAPRVEAHGTLKGLAERLEKLLVGAEG